MSARHTKNFHKSALSKTSRERMCLGFLLTFINTVLRRNLLESKGLLIYHNYSTTKIKISASVSVSWQKYCLENYRGETFCSLLVARYFLLVYLYLSTTLKNSKERKIYFYPMKFILRKLWRKTREVVFSFYLGFLSRAFTIHRTAREGGGYFFKYSLPLPPVSQTLRH